MKLRLLVIIILFHLSAFASDYPLYYSEELKPTVEKVESLPEGSAVIEQVLKQGPLTIAVNKKYPKDFIGYWSSDHRTIYISKNSQTSECTLITALLMELHNALRTDQIEVLHHLATQKRINREQFIEEFEAVEHQNALDAKHLIQVGVQKGLFPYGCSFNIAEDFREHLKIQYQMGHSQWVGTIYDHYAI